MMAKGLDVVTALSNSLARGIPPPPGVENLQKFSRESSGVLQAFRHGGGYI
jgi:hypothetical protein